MDESTAPARAAANGVPPVGEEIHLPEPSVLPMLLAVGITVALVGVTISLVLVVIGLVLTIAVTVRWIREARAELRELPPGRH